MGDYCNMDIKGTITGGFDNYVKSDPIFMHEYGHTVDSRLYGLSYLFAIGVPSMISAANASTIAGKLADTHDYKSYEMRANRKAKRYFGGYYGVSWNTKYRLADYEAYYPTHY